MKGWLPLPGDLYVKPIEMGVMFVIRPNVTQYEVVKMRKDTVELIGTAPTPAAAAKLAMTKLTKALSAAGRRSYRQAQREVEVRRTQPSGLAMADPMPSRPEPAPRRGRQRNVTMVNGVVGIDPMPVPRPGAQPRRDASVRELADLVQNGDFSSMGVPVQRWLTGADMNASVAAWQVVGNITEGDLVFTPEGDLF